MPWCFRSVFPIPKWLFFLANTALEKLWIWLPKTCLSLHRTEWKMGGISSTQWLKITQKSLTLCTVIIKVKIKIRCQLIQIIKHATSRTEHVWPFSICAKKQVFLVFFDNFHILCLGKRVRDRREEDLPTKVPFWWITVEPQRPKQNCIFHLIHSHRSFFFAAAAAFSFLGFTYSMRRSRSAFPLLLLLLFLGGFLSLDFFSWPIRWHILSIIYHDPSCFSYLSWNLEDQDTICLSPAF